MAKLYNGVRSKSSGASETDAGDVRAYDQLIECKMTGKPGKPAKPPGFVKQLEKITEEAWAEGRQPLLALRYFDPESLLANRDGWIDIVVRRAEDDAELVSGARNGMRTHGY